MIALLEIRDLDVRFDTADGEVHAVKRVSLDIGEGECLGVVGESGSGKSQLFLAAMGLLAGNGRVSGSVRYRGTEILRAPTRTLNALRGG
ncbi:MAG TPA: ATP-binding cassette domain-containing protein, partial [Rhizomicrobium sp.]|nr:ATP-binding cassette domain-containing protein [Rhizomicrobium sp.]